MKTAVITDLHANREAVEAVLAHAEGMGAERYALLGDFVGYGADPAWVVDRVRGLVAAGAVAIRGNHDSATVEGPSPLMRDEPRQVIAWSREQLDPGQLAFLEGLPIAASIGEVLFVHANAWAPADWEYILAPADAARSMRATSRRITFCGHMHEPRLYRLARTRAIETAPSAGDVLPLPAPSRWLIVPGAAGQPRDGDPAAAYALHDDVAGTVTFCRVPYDHATAAAKIRAAGLPRALADRLALGI